MNESANARGVIPAQAVRRVQQAVLLECGGAEAAGQAISVVPLLEGQRIRGFQVRCRCGSSVVVECVYPENP
ncbi:MAG: hypothetical protein IT458_20920 [Planctomycetes bacterium]|nr:hypothetical protein [Planctomycetota bacterium]